MTFQQPASEKSRVDVTKVPFSSRATFASPVNTPGPSTRRPVRRGTPEGRVNQGNFTSHFPSWKVPCTDVADRTVQIAPAPRTSAVRPAREQARAGRYRTVGPRDHVGRHAARCHRAWGSAAGARVGRRGVHRRALVAARRERDSAADDDRRNDTDRRDPQEPGPAHARPHGSTRAVGHVGHGPRDVVEGTTQLVHVHSSLPSRSTRRRCSAWWRVALTVPGAQPMTRATSAVLRSAR